MIKVHKLHSKDALRGVLQVNPPFSMKGNRILSQLTSTNKSGISFENLVTPSRNLSNEVSYGGKTSNLLSKTLGHKL